MPFALRFDPVVGDSMTVLPEERRNFLEQGVLSTRFRLMPEGTYMLQVSTTGPDGIWLRTYTGGQFRPTVRLPPADAGTFRTGSVTVTFYGDRRRVYVDYLSPATATSREVTVACWPIPEPA